MVETNNKYLEDLFVQYECGLQKLTEEFKDEICSMHSSYLQEAEVLHNKTLDMIQYVETTTPLLEQFLEFRQDYEKLMAHLKATDAVTLALSEGSNSIIENAKQQIINSEKYGTDEFINRKRLNFEKTNKLMKSLNKGEAK